MAYLSTSPDLSLSSIRISSISRSVINLLKPARHSTLNVRDVSNTLIIASSFDGAVHLTNVDLCVVVLKCHQVCLSRTQLRIVPDA